MAKIEIDPNKLEALHQFLEDGGEFDVNPVFLQLGISGKKQEIFDAYSAALTEKYPDIYVMEGNEPVAEEPQEESEPEPEPQPIPVPAPAAKKQAKTAPAPVKPAPVAAAPAAPTKYLLKHPNGTTQELEVVQTTSKAVVLEPVRRKDIVMVKLKGRDVEVDLELVRAGDQRYFNEYGVPAEKLLMLGELAKA